MPGGPPDRVEILASGPRTGHTRSMEIRRYTKDEGDGITVESGFDPSAERRSSWSWIDVTVTGPDDVGSVTSIAEALQLDPLAVRDAVEDVDLPKLDDFGDSLLLVLHGLRGDRVETYEVDCFLTEKVLLTLHQGASPALHAFADQLVDAPQLADGGVDELLARMADVLNRRLLSVVHAFDDIADDMLVSAVAGEASLLPDLVAVRRDISTIRRSMQPQRDALTDAIASETRLVSDQARRRFSDARDVAERVLNGVESARSVLSETLEAYRGAEARMETQVTKVLTIYAAIVLPLTLLVGFFGMNVPDLPLSDSRNGWWILAVVCVAIASASLGIFVSLGWIKRPTGRGAGRTLGDGLVEAVRTPAQIAGALYEVVLTPLRRGR